LFRGKDSLSGHSGGKKLGASLSCRKERTAVTFEGKSIHRLEDEKRAIFLRAVESKGEYRINGEKKK